MEDRPIFEDLRPRGQGLDLRGQGQELQNVSSRPRMSSRTPPLANNTVTVMPGPAPRGAFLGRAPPKPLLKLPKRKLCPFSSEDCAPKKSTGSVLLEYNIRGLRFQNSVYHPRICEQELFFRRFCNKDRLLLWFHPKIRKNLRIFWDEDLFFFFLFRSLP